MDVHGGTGSGARSVHRLQVGTVRGRRTGIDRRLRALRRRGEQAQPPHTRRHDRPGRRVRRGERYRRESHAEGIRSPRRRRGRLRRVLPRSRREPHHQRDRPPRPQFRSLDLRCLRHQSVRATGSGRMRPAPGIDRTTQARGHGQLAGRSVGERRTGLGGGPGHSGSQAAPLRETGNPART